MRGKIQHGMALLFNFHLLSYLYGVQSYRIVSSKYRRSKFLVWGSTSETDEKSKDGLIKVYYMMVSS